MALYDDGYRAKLQREQKVKHYTKLTQMVQWRVISAEVMIDASGVVHATVALSKERIMETLQHLHSNAAVVGGSGLPLLLEATSASRLRQRDDGRYCLQMPRREYAIMTAALLPGYLEPTPTNIKRTEGFKSVAMHPIIMRYLTRMTDDQAVNCWRLWSATRTLAGYVNATTTASMHMDYAGGLFPMNSRLFVLYTLTSDVLDAMLRFYETVEKFTHAIDNTTIVYDVMAAFFMPRRLEYINHRLIEEVLNLVELSSMHEFCLNHAVMIEEVRKLAAWIQPLDQHSRTRIRVDRNDKRCAVDFDLLHKSVFVAVCDHRLDPYVAMAMMCSMAVSHRKSDALFAFLDAIPTTCQFKKRFSDLYLRLVACWPTTEHDERGQQLLRDIHHGVHDDLLGFNRPPPVYPRPRFPTRRIVGTYTTQTFATYEALVKRIARPLMPELTMRRRPLHALYIFVSSFDRNVAAVQHKRYDEWDLIGAGVLEADRALPLSDSGHYLDEAFFYI